MTDPLEDLTEDEFIFRIIMCQKQVHGPSDVDENIRSCCISTKCWLLLASDLSSFSAVSQRCTVAG